ncbi:MAG TPA: NTP transferase domain-containing protein [Povalibacter sp.]|nr:NTP transferase domain-containing protein [Povalibacter sp.]
MSAAPLFGLVLAGGASTRMQRDKATLLYHGKPQLQWAYELVTEVCAATFVSVRPDQRDEPVRAALPQIVDQQPGIGPLAGIAAALTHHPKAAWLIVACDLPFLTAATLQHLVAHRDPRRVATAYRSAHDSLPEPLCAIWEPAARELVQSYIDAGKQCPRKFLINADTLLLDLPDVLALENVNTVQEFDDAVAALATSGQEPPGRLSSASDRSAITLRIQYYALFREQAGRSEESLDTSAATPAELYQELQQRHPFRLAREQLKVAVNTEFADWNAPLANGDTVVFIPPVAGG